MLHHHFPIGFKNLPLIRLPAHIPLRKLKLVIEVHFILVQHVRLNMASSRCGSVVERIAADLFPFLILSRHLGENSDQLTFKKCYPNLHFPEPILEVDPQEAAVHNKL